MSLSLSCCDRGDLTKVTEMCFKTKIMSEQIVVIVCHIQYLDSQLLNPLDSKQFQGNVFAPFIRFLIFLCNKSPALLWQQYNLGFITQIPQYNRNNNKKKRLKFFDYLIHKNVKNLESTFFSKCPQMSPIPENHGSTYYRRKALREHRTHCMISDR